MGIIGGGRSSGSLGVFGVGVVTTQGQDLTRHRRRRLRRYHGLAISLVVVLVFAAVGFAEWVVWRVEETQPPIDTTFIEARIECEIVAHASLVSEANGRFAHLPGDGHVLVLTRIASPRPTASAPALDAPPSIERLWVSLPEKLEPGDVFPIAASSHHHHIGYDRGRADEGVFVHPTSTVGHLTIVEVRPSAVRLDFDVQVSPEGFVGWRVKDQRVVPILVGGRYALPYQHGRKALDVPVLPPPVPLDWAFVAAAPPLPATLPAIPTDLADPLGPATAPAGQPIDPTPAGPATPVP